ncbi:MAG: hypothetical protein ABIG11_02935 [bacterium]
MHPLKAEGPVSGTARGRVQGIRHYSVGARLPSVGQGPAEEVWRGG